MSITLAFDVYGTLIDTRGVVAALSEIVGDKAGKFAQTWRDKQLEYSFRRGLMRNYENFAVCTGNALDYTCMHYKVSLTKGQKKELLDGYRTLPLFADVKESLTRLRAADFQLYAFSNGRADAVETLLIRGGIRDLFRGIVSVDDLRTFKPDPGVYAYFLSRSGASGLTAWLVSSNPFDVIGAISAGMKAVWVRRSNEVVFDPWEIDPTLTVGSLDEIEARITEYRAKAHPIHTVNTKMPP